MGVKQATNDERRVLWETLLFRSKNGKLKRGDIAQAAADFGFGRSVVSRLWERGIRSMSDRAAAVVEARWNLRGGGKKKDRAALCQKIRDIPKADRRNYRIVKAVTNISDHLMRQLLKEGYLRRALTQTRPLLIENHKIERLKWCVGHVKQNLDGKCLFDAMYDTVHVDKKWFFVKKVGQKVYLVTDRDGSEEEEAPVQHLQSKRNMIKVMFLCAVARPRGNWDGKVGIWPVVEEYTTQRRSANRDAGVVELRSVTMTRVLYRKMLVEKVVPAIKAQWEWPRDSEFGSPIKTSIRLQQDNAKPHVLPNDMEVITAGCSGGWKIYITPQPAQSPDLNALDCGFFNLIQSLQSYTLPRKPEDLIQEVERAFAATTAMALNKTFISIQLIMEDIMKHGGGNAFRLRHMHKDRLLRAGELAVSLSCDASIYLKALQIVAPVALETSHAPLEVEMLCY